MRAEPGGEALACRKVDTGWVDTVEAQARMDSTTVGTTVDQTANAPETESRGDAEPAGETNAAEGADAVGETDPVDGVGAASGVRAADEAVAASGVGADEADTADGVDAAGDAVGGEPVAATVGVTAAVGAAAVDSADVGLAGSGVALSGGGRDSAADRRLGVRVISFLLALCLIVAGYGAYRAARHTESDAAARSTKLAKLPTPPPPRLVQSVPGSFTISGTAPSIPWPSSGQAAVEIQGVGSLGTSGHVNTPVPIASVTKTMTAYLILADHPLAAGAAGPSITVSEADARSYLIDLKAGQSLVEVVAGERISERDALEALMLASADNVAKILARWDAGSVSAFVASMNRAARRLGMTHTTYTDPSGLDPSTVSTASDQIKLAEAAMQSASFRAIVTTRVAQIPVEGTIVNFNRLLGQYGVIGVKTGSTNSAGGCLLFAATVPLGAGTGATETVIGAVFGQPLGEGDDFLHNTLDITSKMIVAAERSRAAATIATPGTLVASVRRAGGGRETPLGVASPVTVVGRPGQTYRVVVSGDAAAPTLEVTSADAGTGGASAGAAAASVTVPLVPLFGRGVVAGY